MFDSLRCVTPDNSMYEVHTGSNSGQLFRCHVFIMAGCFTTAANSQHKGHVLHPFQDYSQSLFCLNKLKSGWFRH